MGPQAMQTFHFNDYPADPPRETINDSHRVYPGDSAIGYHSARLRSSEAYHVLSLEVFNRSYWERSAEVARTGLAKKQPYASPGVTPPLIGRV